MAHTFDLGHMGEALRQRGCINLYKHLFLYHMTRQYKKTGAVIFGMFLAGSFLAFIYFSHLAVNRGFQNFDANNISGKIEQLEMAKSRIMIRLTGNSTPYYLYQETKSYQQHNFYQTVHPGDSIFKKAFSESVLVKHGDSLSVYVIVR
jgi:hypothetical protein